MPNTRYLLRRSDVLALPACRPLAERKGEWLSIADSALYLDMTISAIRKRITRGELRVSDWSEIPVEQRSRGERAYRTFIEKAELDRFSASLYHDRIGILPTHHSLIDLVYAACLLDTEGHVRLCRVMAKGRSYYHPTVGVTNTNPLILEWLIPAFGGSIYHRRIENPRWKYPYICKIDSGVAYQFLRLVRPYVRIKEPQVRLVIEYYDRLRNNNGRHRGPVDDAERLWRDDIVAQITRLNAKGKAVP